MFRALANAIAESSRLRASEGERDYIYSQLRNFRFIFFLLYYPLAGAEILLDFQFSKRLRALYV